MATSRPDSRLLAPGERWGWEYRLVAEDAPAGPDTTTEPEVPAVPEPDWTVPAAERHARAVRHRTRYWQIAAGATVLTVGALLSMVVTGPIGAGYAAVPLGIVAVAAAVLATVPGLRAVRAADTAYRQWVTACLAGHRATDRAPAVSGTSGCVGRWRPVRPVAAARVDVYGGTDPGWAALLSTVAGSVLGSGGSVTVLDITGQSAGRDLIRLAGAAGHRLDLLSLPDHLPAVGLLSDLAPAQVGTVLAEAVHAVDRDPDSGDRSGDATLIGQAVAALGYQDTGARQSAGSQPRRPLTFRRLAGALYALDGATGSDDSLSSAERANLAAAQRQPGNIAAGPRLRRLAAAAAQLALLEEHDPGVRPYRDPHAQLRVMQLLGNDPELPTGLLAQVLAGVLLHQVRRQVPAEGQDRLLVVAGADGLRRTQLERLDQLTRRRGIRLVLLYRRLRADAMAPTGQHAMILMRQQGAAEADRAAALVGDVHPLLVADFTARHRSPLDAVTADSAPAGRCAAPPGLPPLPPRPDVPVPGPQEHPGTRYMPVAGFLRELSGTAFVLLDPQDVGSPRLLDCDPAVLD